MIYDKLENAHLYISSCRGLSQAVAYAQNLDPATPDGRYEIAGKDIYAVVVSYTTQPAVTVPFEAHKKYIDVQFVIRGAELMDVSLDENLEVKTPYSEENDCLLLKAPEHYSSMLMTPGTFAFLYPHDVHRPGCRVDGPVDVRKLVVKIRL